jgi:hypothetical protein
MNDLPDIRDIHGLDTIPWWPPGPGWWLTALLAIALVAFLVWFVREMLRPRWQRDANRQLRRLQMRLNLQDARTSASELSELLRRIAMARYGREKCAGLSGKEWLEWLTASDPAGFNWTRYDAILNDLPYAPKDIEVDPFDIRLLVRATRQWVNTAAERTPARRISTQNV